MKIQKKYMLAVDQSTQGTKALLLDKSGKVVERYDVMHRQIINAQGWVEHDLEEIWENTQKAIRGVIEKSGISPFEIAGLGISNQRETIAAWNRKTGKPVYHAIVWQCSRGEQICESIRSQGYAQLIQDRTGLNLSPYFSASKLAWILQNVEEARLLAERGELCCGTMDSWLVYQLTDRKVFRTDCSNASRTQLMNLRQIEWDEEICRIFGIPTTCLPRICDSDAEFGETDVNGYLPEKIPLCCVMGDSHGALFGQGCLTPGTVKATYGTGSSIMMNVGEAPLFSKNGLVSSVAWGREGKVWYVLEGNINDTGAVVTWMKDRVGLIVSAAETEALAEKANSQDRTYFVPAFSGLGAPYWDSEATATFTGITRMTGKAELVKAALECIAYQIYDVVDSMNRDLRQETGKQMAKLRVDGGPTKNRYLMQFQSDISGIPIEVPAQEELSGIGAAYMGGLRLGFYQEEQLFETQKRTEYRPRMEEQLRRQKLAGWKKAVQCTLTH